MKGDCVRMNNQSNEPKKQDKLTMGIGAGLVVSIILNVVLGAQLMGASGPSDQYNGKESTDSSFYDERVVTLEKENTALEKKLATLEKNTTASSEKSDSSTAPVGQSSKVDQTRNAVQSTVDGFLEAYLTMDTDKQSTEQRRALLEKYVSRELLAQLAPNASELEDMGIVGHEDASDAAKPEYTYTQTLDEKHLYIEEKSLTDKNVQVVAETVTHVKDNMDAEYDLNERYSLTLEQNGSDWIVTEYSLEQIK